MEDKWSEIKNKCLSKALALLNAETVPTAATAETVKRLVETAIMINKTDADSPIGPEATIRLGGT